MKMTITQKQKKIIKRCLLAAGAGVVTCVFGEDAAGIVSIIIEFILSGAF